MIRTTKGMKGEKVICISDIYNLVSKGTVYEVLDDDHYSGDDKITITDDDGTYSRYLKKDFITLTERRNKTLTKLLDE